MIDLTASTMDELQAEFVRLATVVSETEGQRQQILAEMENRKRLAVARVKLGGMSEDDKAALREVLQVEAKPADAPLISAAEGP